MLATKLGVVFLYTAAISAQKMIQPADLWRQPVAEADRKLAYGKDPLQFGELRLPRTHGPHPVVIIVHGGCFLDRLPKRDPRDTTFEPLRPLAAALADAGVATWNLEYRRAGNPGGGWPGSYLDLAAGTDFLRTIARANRLDLKRVVLVGHSAGGTFVHWLAARPKLPRSSPLYSAKPLRVKGVVNVDGPPDLAPAQPLEMKFCGLPAISQFMGGSAAEKPERYRDGSALPVLPLGVPQTIVAGGLLRSSYALVSDYEAAAVSKGDVVTVLKLDGSGHFDMLAPDSEYGKSLLKAILALLK
jgi:acetyl esterase/lipase